MAILDRTMGHEKNGRQLRERDDDAETPEGGDNVTGQARLVNMALPMFRQPGNHTKSPCT